MKKNRFLTLAMMGVSLSLLSSCGEAKGDAMSGEMKAFYDQLEPDAQKKFQELDESHKKAAMAITQEKCGAETDCKGIREQAVQEQYDLQKKERGNIPHQ